MIENAVCGEWEWMRPNTNTRIQGAFIAYYDEYVSVVFMSRCIQVGLHSCLAAFSIWCIQSVFSTRCIHVYSIVFSRAYLGPTAFSVCRIQGRLHSVHSVFAVFRMRLNTGECTRIWLRGLNAVDLEYLWIHHMNTSRIHPQLNERECCHWMCLNTWPSEYNAFWIQFFAFWIHVNALKKRECTWIHLNELVNKPHVFGK